MDTLDITKEFWYILGFILILAEFIMPGFVVMFLGLASITVGVGMHLSLIHTFYEMFLVWILSSTLFLFTLRNIFTRVAPGQINVGEIDEDKAAIGTHVQVIQEIKPNQNGRIEFRGTTWEASSNAHLNISEMAEIVARNGQVFEVRPIQIII